MFIQTLGRGLTAFFLLLQLPVIAASDGDDLANLKRDIEALKTGQQEITQDLAEIKQLLESGKPSSARPPAVQDFMVVMDVTGSPVQGDTDAPITLVEMTDFECPFCGRHVKNVKPEILRNYVSTGKLRYIVRDFPLNFHKNAEKAAEAAHCAGEQGKYWEMHDILFANQKSLGEENLHGYASQAGLDTNAFSLCLDSARYAERVKASHEEGSRIGVTGTPTTFLGLTQEDGTVKLTKRITGARPFQIFQQSIEGMLQEQNQNTRVIQAPSKSPQPTAAFR